MIKSIPLANLIASPRNVRKVQDEAADAELAASIAARGLLQNLVVTPTSPKGMYAVEAGGRRLRALHKLQFDGVLPVDHKVACLVLGKDDGAAASEASLAENFHRLAMNPADECTAFGKLIEQGCDVEGVARRFGLTVRFVEGRLRLANLAPQVFEALGAGEITLDAAKAYAATSDQERQAWVFEQLQNSWSGAHPDSIRRMMVNATVPASDRRFLYVGEDAYVAAGGRLERDLFADASEARVLDVALLERLAAEKLEADAERLAQEHGWGFVRPTLDAWVNGWQYDDLQRLAVEAEPLSDAETEAIRTFEAEIEAQIAVIEDEDADDHARDAAEGKIRELNAAIDAIADKPLAISPEAKAQTGVFVLIDERGEPRLDRTVYALIGEDEDGDSEGGDGSASRDAGQGGTTGASPGNGSRTVGASTTSEPKAPKLSQRLIDELAMQRRDILSIHVAADPTLALDLAVVLMLADEGGYAWDGGGSTLTARRPSDPVLTAAMPAQSAAIAEAKAKAEQVLDRSWLDCNSMAERFDAFRQLPQAQRDAWLGHAVARTLEASVFGQGLRGNPFHDHLGRLLGIDVASWWRPTALNWFDRVSKAQCLAALEEVGGTELSARYAKARKPEIAEACERVFAGSTIVEAGVKARALAWVPEPMRFAGDETPPWAVEDEVDAAPDEVLMAMSDETAVFDASGSEDDAGEDDGGDGDAISGGTPSASVEAEPIVVTFVTDDPNLARVTFEFDTSGEGADDEPGEGQIGLAA